MSASDTYQLEDLPPPTPMEATSPYNLQFLQNRISDIHAMSIKGNLIDGWMHPFLSGYERAFRQHCPVTISPDIIYLLICQGFSHHVRFNSESLRHLFVNFEGKKELVVNKLEINWYTAPPELLATAFPEFASQIAGFVGKPLVDTLTCDFTTTTPTILTSSQLTIMCAFQDYFKYKVLFGGSGYPSITIEGTVQDWEHLAEKVDQLAKYELEWWIKEIRPILQKIIETKKGNFDREFWLGMLRYHDPLGDSGDVDYIDGWITKFFPYSKSGKKMSLDRIEHRGIDLPCEQLSVPVKVEIYDPDLVETLDTQIQTGFVGLTQDPVTFNVKAEIGWVWYRNYVDPVNDRNQSY